MFGKMNLRIMMKNHEADLELGFFIKTDFKAVFPRNGHAASVGVNKPKKIIGLGCS